MQKEDYRDYYQSKEKANEYDEDAYFKDSYVSILWKLEKDILIRFIESIKDSSKKIRYLDFACGTGRILAEIENLVDESYGIDISSAMLENAAMKTKRSTLLLGDVTKDKNIISGKFDLITTFRFILNAQPELRDSALKIISEKLRSRESWLIFNMHTNKYSYAYISYLWYFIFGQSPDKDTKRYMSKEDCIKIAYNAGLSVKKTLGVGFISGRFYRMFPVRLALYIESILSKIPIFNLTGTDLIFFCQKSKDNINKK